MAVCGTILNKCMCGIDKEVCDGKHMCIDPECGGSWKEGVGDIIILLIPFRLTWIRQATATYETLDTNKSWDERRETVRRWQEKSDY